MTLLKNQFFSFDLFVELLIFVGDLFNVSAKEIDFEVTIGNDL
jgi:hypothetical protein